MNSTAKLIALVSALILLAGCGGGGSGGGDDEVTNTDAGIAIDCGSTVDIGENATLDGRLEEGDCTVNDLDPNTESTAFVDGYRVTIPIDGVLQITMRSADINSFLAIVDATDICTEDCNPVVVLDNDDDSGGGDNGLDAQISIELTAGTYVIFASSVLPESGDYSLETVFMDLDQACGDVVDISENAIVSGRLTATDCTLSQLITGSTDASYVDEFRVTLPDNGTLQITMRSTEVDAFLAILDTTGTCFAGCNPAIALAFDDDSGLGVNGSDAYISILLTAGTYMIHTNSFDPGETGIYSLETMIE